jgi:hypothetical protein
MARSIRACVVFSILLPILLTFWLVTVGFIGIIIYRAVFHYDATSWIGWAETYRQFQAGATIPFDFVATGALLALLAIAGCVALTLRAPRLAAGLTAGWLLDDLRQCERSRVSGLPTFRRNSAAWRAMLRRNARRTLSWVRASLVHKIRLVAQMAVDRAPPMAGWGRWREGDTVSSDSRPLASGVEPAVVGKTAGTASRAADITFRPAALLDAASDGEARTTGSSLRSADADDAATEQDIASFGRAMALFEVWAEPTPEWMGTALREELDKLSTGGWKLFAGFGAPALALYEAVVRNDLLPAEPERRATIEAILCDCLAKRGGTIGVAEDDVLENQDTVSSDTAPSPLPATMTLSAAWLCELLDNYVMLDSLRSADGEIATTAFEARWGGVFRETVTQLKSAMASMRAKDWSSIDRFPELAGRVRILTDRLREDFRAGTVGATKETSNRAIAAPPRAPPVQAAGMPESHADPSGVGQERLVEKLEVCLVTMGFKVTPLPPSAGFGSQVFADMIARQGGIAVLLRLAWLDHRQWQAQGDSLARWRSNDGSVMPSPCRAVWQRLVLLRSLAKDDAPRFGLVVVAGGEFVDEAAMARWVEVDRRRTGVGLVWFDREGADLASLPAELDGLLKIKGDRHPEQ